MKKIVYWLCFILIAFPTTYSLVAQFLTLFGITFRYPSALILFFSFGSLVPLMFVHIVPKVVLVVLGYAMTFLILRRAWLFIAKKERVPPSFRSFQMALGFVGAGFFVLFSVVLLLSITLHAGSGVPAGMFLIPAIICVPWSFFLTEIFSFKKHNVNSEEV